MELGRPLRRASDSEEPLREVIEMKMVAKVIICLRDA